MFDSLKSYWNFISLIIVSFCTLLRRDEDPAQVQFHGCRPGKERALPCPGHLLPRCRWQRHAAQLLRGRCHHPAGARSPRWLALWGEWKEQDVSIVLSYSILSHMSVTVNVKYKSVVTFLRRGWFPFSYTRVLPESDSEKLKVKYVAFFSQIPCVNLMSPSLSFCFPPLPACTMGKVAAQGTCWRMMDPCPHLTMAWPPGCWHRASHRPAHGPTAWQALAHRSVRLNMCSNNTQTLVTLAV